MTTHAILSPRYSRTEKWAFGVFWFWNLIFIAFFLLGFAPRIMPDLVLYVRHGLIPIPYLVYGIVLVSIPFIAVLLGLTILRREPRRLFVLGYTIEGPLMLLLLIRFFVIRDATPAVSLLSVITIAGMGVFIWNLLDKRPQDRPVSIRYLKVIGLSLYLLLALYASVWVAFYALPLLAWAGTAIFNFLIDIVQQLSTFWRSLEFFKFGGMVIALLGVTLLVSTGTLVVLMPIVVPILAVRAWINALRALPALPARRTAGVLSSATLVLVIVLMILAVQQPQHRAFALLAEPPQSPAEAQALIRQQEVIRKGLLNAYLAPVRYLSSVGGVGHVRDMYAGAFKLEDEQAKRIQDLYELVVRPLLYEPVEPVASTNPWEDSALQTEPLKAALLYESFFDEPIHVAERDTIVRAVRSTWNGEQATAAWQAIDDREIHLAEQEININEHGDWAEIELYEVYINQTRTFQEAIYYFSLPESAVLTGIWLNDRPGKRGRFEYVVSPRGAAQAIYRNEKVQQQDPALLEQIGPRQYRLRVFPIMTRQWVWGDNRGNPDRFEDKPMYMWMTYRVLAQNGEWPLPRLAEVRNVYWDSDSQRQVAGQPFAGEEWLPESIPTSGPVTASTHQYTFASGETVAAIPLAETSLPALTDDIRLALVLDRSRSMQRYAAEVQEAMTALMELQERGADVDVYLTASVYMGEAPSVTDVETVSLEAPVYFGGQNASELLAQFNQLSQGKPYDGVLILTDGSGYELGSAAAHNEIPQAPLWLVHLNGDFPLGYDDDTLQAIQASGGGVAGSLDEAFSRIAVAARADELAASLNAPAGSSRIDVMDGYAWLSYPAGAKGIAALTSAPDADFSAFAARRAILNEMQRSRGSIKDLAVLDALHAIAVEHHVVSPYSSMIVLVNAQQRRNLELLEGQTDRFAREFEGSGDTVPQAFTVTGVPEPEEWLLMALAAGLLAWYYRKSLKGKLNIQGRSGIGLH
jgi:putative PEP-CTERM system integral membrane protein